MVPLFLSLWWNEYVVCRRRIPMANAVGTECIPNFLMLQATSPGSAPASAGEFSGVSHRSGRKEWAVSLFHTSCLLKRWPSWLFPDRTKFTRKLPTAVMVGFAFTKFIVLFQNSLLWVCLGFFFVFAAFLVNKGSNTIAKSEKQTQAFFTHDLLITASFTSKFNSLAEKSPKGIKSLLYTSKQLFLHLSNSGGFFFSAEQLYKIQWVWTPSRFHYNSP